MVISIIGMSNIGKSYWSKRLQNEKDFVVYSCDDMIEQRLAPYLQNLGYKGIADVSKWMGQPYEPQYPENSEIYLEFEKEVMQEIFTKLANNTPNINVAIDTTGSVIYTGDNIINQLRQLSKVVYLPTPSNIQDQMLQLFIREPKPVYWGEIYQPIIDEGQEQALSRCYKLLLNYRTQRYESICDITLDYLALRDPQFTIDQFIENIKLIINYT
jgi:shikimate kinase